MRRWAEALVLALAMVAPIRAELPKDLEELKERHAETGTTPEGALKCWFDACFVYMNEETRDAGREMIQFLTIPYKDQPEWDRAPAHEYFIRALQRDQHIMRSYAKGATPDNNYEMDPDDYVLNITRVNTESRSSSGIQVYVRSGGASMPRPLYMKKSTSSGLWYMNAHTNVYVGIQPPKDPNQEEFE